MGVVDPTVQVGTPVVPWIGAPVDQVTPTAGTPVNGDTHTEEMAAAGGSPPKPSEAKGI